MILNIRRGPGSLCPYAAAYREPEPSVITLVPDAPPWYCLAASFLVLLLP